MTPECPGKRLFLLCRSRQQGIELISVLQGPPFAPLREPRPSHPRTKAPTLKTLRLLRIDSPEKSAIFHSDTRHCISHVYKWQTFHVNFQGPPVRLRSAAGRLEADRALHLWLRSASVHNSHQFPRQTVCMREPIPSSKTPGPRSNTCLSEQSDRSAREAPTASRRQVNVKETHSALAKVAIRKPLLQKTPELLPLEPVHRILV